MAMCSFAPKRKAASTSPCCRRPKLWPTLRRNRLHTRTHWVAFGSRDPSRLFVWAAFFSPHRSLDDLRKPSAERPGIGGGRGAYFLHLLPPRFLCSGGR